MEDEIKLGLEFLRTAASLAVPFVLVWAAHFLQRRQKFLDAVMSEKANHYSTLSPLLNIIFSYRMRVGDFLDRAPESVLEAERKADHEFWTFEYLWSNGFRVAYHEFMDDAFKAFNEEGTKALIRADLNLYRLKPSSEDWAAFTGESVGRKMWANCYGTLKAAIAHDLGFVDFETNVVGIGK